MKTVRKLSQTSAHADILEDQPTETKQGKYSREADTAAIKKTHGYTTTEEQLAHTETGKAHSPLPWVQNGIQAHSIRSRESGLRILTLNSDVERISDDERKANAALIVASVNHADKLAERMKGLFEHCAMVHKHWGDGCNQAEADAAIKAAQAELAAYDKAKGAQ